MNLLYNKIFNECIEIAKPFSTVSLSAGEPRTVSVSAREPRAAVFTEGMFSLFVVLALTDIVGKEQEQDRIERCKLLRNEDQVKFKL